MAISFLSLINHSFAVAPSSPLVKQAEVYLNSLTNISAKFVQKSSNNLYQSGNFILLNSQDVRWEYKKPRNIVITFCKNKIFYHDKDLNNKEIYSIENPFVEFIATRPINLDLHKNFFIREIKEKHTEFELIISNIQKSVGSFILVFKKTPIKLTKVVLFDDFGSPIEISFTNLTAYSTLPENLLFHCGQSNE